MMMRLVTACALVAGLALPAMAQAPNTTNMEILRQKITADKKLVVAQNLQLTDAEGATFWPVYDAYQKDLQQINQRLAAAIKAYAEAYNKGPVTNETAIRRLSEKRLPSIPHHYQPAVRDAEAGKGYSWRRQAKPAA